MLDQEQQTAREPSWEQPGGLGLRDTRSWRTWQMITAIVLALIVGMIVGHIGGSSSLDASSAPLFSLPADASSAPSASTPAVETESAKPAARAKTGPAVVLMPNINGTGTKTLRVFTAGGAWKVGWAFNCVLANSAAGSFKVFVVPDGGTVPDSALFEKSGRSGDGITAGTTLGAQHLHIQADEGCRWAVKVTGVA